MPRASAANQNRSILIAGTPISVAAIERWLPKPTRLTEARSFDEAVQRLQENVPDIVIVGYHFDELRPYRLVQHIRKDRGFAMPVVLVQVFAVEQIQSKVNEIQAAYQALGVQAFVSWPEEVKRLGEEKAAKRFCELVLKLTENSGHNR